MQYTLKRYNGIESQKSRQHWLIENLETNENCSYTTQKKNAIVNHIFGMWYTIFDL